MLIGVVGNRNGWELLDVKHNLRKEGITEKDIIITGGAEGVDSFSVWYAKSIGADVIIYHPRISEGIPERYFNRNKRIVDAVARLIAFDLDAPWNEHSGTRYTINYAIKKKIPLKIISQKG
jgi:hypothetical protein